MSDPDELKQRLYALCGETLCWAQLLEQEILNAILLHAVAREKITTRSEAEDLLTQKDKQPLRNKLNEIFKRVKTEPDLSPTFYEAVEKRNFFVHKFFWDRFEDSFTEEGQQRLIVEVKGYSELFRSAYLWSKGITQLYAKQAGMTDAMIVEEMEQIIPDQFRK